jgi:hypothetical protein
MTKKAVFWSATHTSWPIFTRALLSKVLSQITYVASLPRCFLSLVRSFLHGSQISMVLILNSSLYLHVTMCFREITAHHMASKRGCGASGRKTHCLTCLARSSRLLAAQPVISDRFCATHVVNINEFKVVPHGKRKTISICGEHLIGSDWLLNSTPISGSIKKVFRPTIPLYFTFQLILRLCIGDSLSPRMSVRFEKMQTSNAGRINLEYHTYMTSFLSARGRRNIPNSSSWLESRVDEAMVRWSMGA